MHHVELRRQDPLALRGVVEPKRLDRLVGEVAPAAATALGGRPILNLNSTSAGGGVAEMLWVLLPLVAGVGIDVRWHVVDGGPPFFVLTKRIHNHLYGREGDGGSLGADAHDAYDEVMRANAADLPPDARDGAVVVLHDPQTAGLAQVFHDRGCRVVWRCHVGLDEQNEHSLLAWDFLRPYLEPFVDAYVFTRREFAPAWVRPEQLAVITPSIDPLATKNLPLAPDAVRNALIHAGLLGGRGDAPGEFGRTDGQRQPFSQRLRIDRSGAAPTPDDPLLVQVSRWDPMKDMAGVMQAFVDEVAPATGAHLALVGPDVDGVSDDPEGAQILDAVRSAWTDLPAAARDRVHLVCVPMDDAHENAALVNAVQRHATVVGQKSLAEGFGLTVTEAMLKARPVVATAVGGIVDQIEHGCSGLLVDDPADLTGFGAEVRRLLLDDQLAARIGQAANQRARDRFLSDHHLERWADLLTRLA